MRLEWLKFERLKAYVGGEYVEQQAFLITTKIERHNPLNII